MILKLDLKLKSIILPVQITRLVLRTVDLMDRFTVTGISSAKSFTVGLATDPGTFNNDVDNRTTDLPFFKRKKYNDTYYVYRLSESQ